MVRLHLAGRGAGPVAKPGSFVAAELLTRLHPAQEASDTVYLFTVSRTELLKAGGEFFGWLAALCSLLLDFIEKTVQFCVDLKKRICFGNRCHGLLPHWSCGLPAASSGNSFLNGGCPGRLVGKHIGSGLDRMTAVPSDPSPTNCSIRAQQEQFAP